MVFLLVQLLIGLLILIQFNKLTIIFGCLALIPVFIYPLMKKNNLVAPSFLGITFNWGALLGWLSLSNDFFPFTYHALSGMYILDCRI